MIYLVTCHMNSVVKKQNILTFWTSLNRLLDFQKELMKYEWSHYIDDTWLISTIDTEQQIFDKLKVNITGMGDYIMVLKFPESGYIGLMPDEQWEWIDEQRKSIPV